MTKPLDYKNAGVDVKGADVFVERIAALAAATHGDLVVPHKSKYAGLVRIPSEGMGRPLLAATCDGVGTKLLVAREAHRFDGLGQDLVAMSVNDLLPLGARPLLFLDYIAVGKLEPAMMEAVVAGVARACSEVGCALAGGETAEMPGLYAPGDFDLAGFAVGLVDEAKVPDPSEMGPGDSVFALPSTGVHSNGFSLARAALFERGSFSLHDTPELLGGQTVADALLVPTALYVQKVLALLAHCPIRAAAHITGGGLLGRCEKLVGERAKMVIDLQRFSRPAIFTLIEDAGRVESSEMARTFNMGLGFVVVLSAAAARAHEALLFELGFLHVGELSSGSGVALTGLRE